MRKLWCYLIFIAWISYLLSSGLLLFVDGFFLNRVARTERSECILCESQDTCDARKIFRNSQTSANICLQPRGRVVLLIVDALKYEFLDWHQDVASNSTHHLNKIPIVHDLLRSHPESTRLLKFIADPPTTTMQRLKALTTGTLPTFLDASSNFATDSVDEDNLIDQTSRRGGVVFMGDDTWTLLFPGKFLRQFPSPSFNVQDLDTVDREVRARIAFELKKKDWLLLVAHTLGVDHCGHKHGQSHPEMARKLGDTDRLIREIVDAIDDDTILFVIGDHGMTESGDHGGDSQNEIEAGMFVYSKIELHRDASEQALTMVNQIDLVPTLSFILGIPVPFSNIGTLIFECLPRGNVVERGEENLWFAAHSVWRNLIQIKKYLEAYSKDTFLFTEEELKELDELFIILEEEAKNVYDEKSFQRFFENSRMYLKSIRNLCAEIWVQFDAGLMSKGLVLFFCTLFFVYILMSGIDETRMNEIMKSHFLLFVVGANITTSLMIYVLSLLRLIDEFKNSNFFATGTVSLVLLVILIVQNWDSVSSTWYNGARQRRINYLDRGILLLMFFSLFSNSYIIEEDKLLAFLLVTSVALLIHRIIDEENFFISDKHEKRTKYGKYLASSGTLRILLILLGFVACTAVRVSSYFWRCREEQDRQTCTNFAGKVGFSNNQGAERILLTTSVIILAVYVTIVTNWLRNGERLSAFLPTINVARYCSGVVTVCIGCYWVFQRLPKNARVKVAISKQINALPGIIYFFVILGIFVVYSRPLGIYLRPRRDESTSACRDQDTVGKLLDRVKELSNSRKSTEEPKFVAVYRSSTVYSAAFISLSVFVTLLWALLLGNVLALGTFMMFVTCIAVLGIVAMERFHNANNVAELLQVSSSAILCWFLIAEYFFYGTGHQPTFPTIHWDAAFIGTGGHFYGQFLPAILIGLNTFGCHLIMALTLPLLAIVPFTVYVMIPEIAKLRFRVDDDMRKGELVLFERDSIFHNALFSVYGKYILLHGLRTFGCMLTTTIHCRHLMVWKIFAPKLIFQGLSFLISLGSVLASAFMVQRIDRQVDGLKSQVVMKNR